MIIYCKFIHLINDHYQRIFIAAAEGDSKSEVTGMKQQLVSSIGTEELHQKLIRQVSTLSMTHSDSESTVDPQSLHRQQSIDSQKSLNIKRNNSIKENNTIPAIIGEKIIEAEKAETGSVS